MENEVVIHVRVEDNTDKGFAAVRAKAKKVGEQIEQDLKQAGRKGGASLADGIGEGLDSGQGTIFGRVTDLGSGVSGILGDAGENAGRNLGQGVTDGFDAGAPDILSGATTLGADIADEMKQAGERAGKNLGDGIAQGMKGASGGDDDGDGLIPGVGKKGFGAGKKAGQSFVSAFGAAVSGLSDDPRIMGALVGAAIAASPLIGATLGAAVIGGAAGVGIVGGFAAAAANPLVKGSVKALGDVIEDDLKASVVSFVPAAVGAVDDVRQAWKRMLPEIESIFTQSGALVDPLLDGILDGVDAIVDGIEDAIGNSGPVVESFGDMFREVGGALGDLISGISDEADTFAATIDFLTGVFVALIDVIHIFIEASAPLIDAFRPIGGLIADAANAADGWIERLTGVSDESEGAAGAQEDFSSATQDATGSVDAQIEALHQLEETMRKQTDPLFEVFELQTKVKTAQEKYNKAVAESGPESAKARKALVDMGRATVDLTGALTDAAGEGFNGKLTPAMRSALKAAGLSAKEMNALEKELIQAWRASEKWAGTYTATYYTEFKGRNTIGGTGYAGLATGGVAGAANGSTSSGMTMVGEHGPELLRLPAGTQVHSNPDTVRKMSDMGERDRSGSPYGKALAISFDPSGMNKLVRAIMETMRAEIRDQGGNVQTVLGVSGVG